MYSYFAGVANAFLYCRRSIFFSTYWVSISDPRALIHLLFARNSVVHEPQNGS